LGERDGRSEQVRTWEYKKIALNEASREGEDIDVLCDAGEQGWELVAITANNVAYFKREVTNTLSKTAGRDREAAETATQAKVKYRDPATGDTWSGRGRMAAWLKRKQDGGEDIGKYLVEA
jgi:DNA-binding protein H-NS